MNSDQQQNQIEEVQQIMLKTPWKNAYWFARMLINNDKYGAIGKENKLLTDIYICFNQILYDKKLKDAEKIMACINVLENLLITRFTKAKTRIDRVYCFIKDISEKFVTTDDIYVFILTAEKILIPINKALEEIPSNDIEYTEATAKAYINTLGDAALASVLRFWDDAGVEGCLSAERMIVIREFTYLQHNLPNLPEYETNIILTAFIQEFERRLGQKRKARAGGSLEDVTSFLFKHYGIKADHAPEHFQADIEVDKWVKCKDKWLIGISCKRTLRERWKQVSSATAEVLTKFKIRQIWHLSTYDEDLSDDKLSSLGSLRHIFYLRDESRQLSNYKNHIGLNNYVRPMSQFITDLKKEIAK